MSVYKIVIKDNSGNSIGEFDRFSDLTFSRVLNREGACSFSIPLEDIKTANAFIQLGLYRVYIYRGIDLVWGGYMESYDGILRTDATTMRILCKGFFNLLKSRYTDKLVTYTGIDAGAIAADLIADSAAKTNGTLPITAGTIQASVNHDRTYEFKQIHEAIVQLSEVNYGFDFEVTPAGVFNVYYPFKGADKSLSHIFKLGRNVERIRYVNTVENMCNEAIVIGSYVGDAMVYADRSNTALQTSYKLWQKVIPYKDIEGQDNLDAKGDDELLRYGLPRREYEVAQSYGSDPEWPLIEVGDYVTLDATSGYIQINDVVRVKEINVTVGEGGLESVSYNFMYT